MDALSFRDNNVENNFTVDNSKGVTEECLVTEISYNPDDQHETCPIKSITHQMVFQNDEELISLDLALSVFPNRIVLVVSEVSGAIGNWVLAKTSEMRSGNSNDFCRNLLENNGLGLDCDGVVSTRVIFGADEGWLHILARRTALAFGSSKSLLCSFTLKRFSGSHAGIPNPDHVKRVNLISDHLVQFINQIKLEKPKVFLLE